MFSDSLIYDINHSDSVLLMYKPGEVGKAAPNYHFGYLAENKEIAKGMRRFGLVVFIQGKDASATNL